MMMHFKAPLAVLLLAGAVWTTGAHGQSTSTPSDPLLDAFRSVCTPNLPAMQALRADAAKMGWKTATDAPKVLKALVERAGTSNDKDAASPTAELLASEKLKGKYAVLISAQQGERRVNGCYLYDLAATKPVDDQLLYRWLGLEPGQVRGEAQSARISTWLIPLALPNYLQVKNAFIAPNSPIETRVGYAGVVLSATALEAKAR